MNISKEGIDLIKEFEGCELTAYRCSANVLTIAYGRIKGVKEGDTCTKEQAEEWLLQNQFDALVSWVYNLGPSNLKSSTLLKVLNAGEYKSVPEQIKRWNKAGGKVLEGLTRRRQAEALLFEGRED
mgnify:CR=1 FL=1